jgi:hypothetical protein
MHGLLSYLRVEALLLLAQIEPEELDDDSVWEGWGSVVFVTGLAVLIAAIIIAGLWFIRGVAISRAHAARDEAFQKLAEQSTSVQEQFLGEQKRMAGDLGELRTRVESIERILREVE